jgi:hypothetical protein
MASPEVPQFYSAPQRGRKSDRPYTEYVDVYRIPDAPHWITQADGRLVAFDADRHARSIFHALQALGTSNALYARELSEGVLHFLSEDAPPAPLTTNHLAERTETLLRALANPALARAYAQLRQPLLAQVKPHDGPFPPELLSAEAEGLLTLHDRAYPGRLAAGIVTWERRHLPCPYGAFVACDVPTGANPDWPTDTPATALHFHRPSAEPAGLFEAFRTGPTLFDLAEDWETCRPFGPTPRPRYVASGTAKHPKSCPPMLKQAPPQSTAWGYAPAAPLSSVS